MSADKIADTLREKIKQQDRIIEAARQAAFPEIIDAGQLGKWGFPGDKHAPTSRDLQSLSYMYDELYIIASEWRTSIDDWVEKEHKAFCDPIRKKLKEAGKKDAYIESALPMFEDWFIYRYLRSYLWLIKGKTSLLISTSLSAFEREQEKEETAAALSALQLAVIPKKGIMSTLRTAPIDLEDLESQKTEEQ